MAKKDSEEEYKKNAKAMGADFEDNEDEDDTEDEDESDDDSEDEDEDESDDDEDSEDDDSDEDDDDDEDDSDEDEDKSKSKSKKKSIYSEYKGKKKENKELKGENSTLKQQKAELEEKLKAYESADDEDKDDALDELEEFAKEIKADPKVIKKMRDLFMKGLKPDESMKKDLLGVKEFVSKHAKDMAMIRFNEDFDNTLPFLEEMFPNASKKETKAIKEVVEKLVHTKGEWSDKELDYVIFKNKDKLSKLISPKKKGLESRERKDVDDFNEDDFDAEADLTDMTPKQRVIWEKQYNKIMKRSSGLAQDSKGRKLII